MGWTFAADRKPLAATGATGATTGSRNVQAVESLMPARMVSVKVDLGHENGTIPRVLRPGFFAFSQIPPVYLQEKILKELRLGTVEIDIGRDILENALDMDDALGRLALAQPFMKKAQAAGADIVLGFSKIPPFLSSRQGDRTQAMPGDTTTVEVVSPPRDYKQWSNLMRAIAAQLKAERIKVRYKIGWEPETRNWHGTEEDFFQMYRASVLGVRQADSTAMIGGPGVSSFAPHWKRNANEAGMLQNFIQYCGKTPLPELQLPRLPIDFLAFHMFDSNPVTSSAAAAQVMKHWLTGAGYPQDTPLFIGEWSDVAAGFAPLREEPYLASFIVSSVISMDRAGVTGQALTSLVEQQTKEDTEFSGGFGVFTKSYFPRVSYQALRMLSMIPEKRLQVDVNDPWVAAAAGLDANGMALIFTNYVPAQPAMLRLFVDRMLQRGRPLGEIAKYFTDEKAIAAFIQGQALPAMPADLASDFNAVRAEIVGFLPALQQRANGPLHIDVTINGTAPLGPITVRQYIIDGKRNNPAASKTDVDRAVLSRQRQDRQNINDKITSILTANNRTSQDIALVKNIVASGNIKTALDRLPLQSRMQALTLLREVLAGDEAATGAFADGLSQLPGIRLAPSMEKSSGAQPYVVLNMDLEPNAVVLITIDKAGTASGGPR